VLGYFVARYFRGVFFVFAFEAPDALGFPDAEEKHGGDERNYAGGDVHQVAVHVVCPKELGASERQADDQDRRKNLPSFGPADHGANQPEGDDHSGDGKDAADHGTEVAFRESRDGG